MKKKKLCIETKEQSLLINPSDQVCEGYFSKTSLSSGPTN